MTQAQANDGPGATVVSFKMLRGRAVPCLQDAATVPEILPSMHTKKMKEKVKGYDQLPAATFSGLPDMERLHD